jgi:hypothetical protein
MKIMKIAPALLVASLSLGATSGVAAGRCSNSAFLRVGGNIAKVNNPDEKVFDFSEGEILAMPESTIVTSTAWTRKSTFQGVRLSDLLTEIGASGKTLRVTAWNDYAADIEWSDLEKYGVILAYKQNDARLSRKGYGPLFVIYPRDSDSALNTPMAQRKYVWQVCRIDVE